MRRVFIAFAAACSLTSPGVFGQTPAAMGRVEGAVSVGVSSGHAFAAGATVRLSGPVVLETETDENGNYTFAAVASGTYRIETFLSGLEAARTISVEAGKIVRTELQLKPADVKSSVTVTATAPETKDPAPFDLQITRPLTLPFGEKHLHARVGMGVFNLFNHFDPRDVQNNLASARFGQFFNTAWREYRGKFVMEF